jgi:putative glutamine amidotransferase
MNIAVTSGAFSISIIKILNTYFPVNAVSISNSNPLYKDFDFYIFSGGSDINPEIYGEENRYCYYIDKNRDLFESKVFTYAYKLKKKILGICRGHQLINALLGGKLYQDLYEIETAEPHGYEHNLDKINSGLIPEIFTSVNSLHHQAVKIPGENLIPTTMFNNCIESTENNHIITVQFHPEIMHNKIQFFNKILLWTEREK